MMLRMLVSASLLAGCAVPALALQQGPAAPVAATQDPTAHDRISPEDAAITGEYSLGGVMETGSGLLLRDDGSFEWYFSYGALDLGARGTWTRMGNVVELRVVDMGYPPQIPQAKFERMRLRIDNGGLVPAWPWDMDGFRKDSERGRYARD